MNSAPVPRARPDGGRVGTLVLGYGNELRGDDALGPMAVSVIETWGTPGTVVLSRHQLTPELAEPISRAQRVLFIDAARPGKAAPSGIHAIRPARAGSLSPHRSDPRMLLALARLLYGRAPRAWMLAIPAEDFEYGAPLTPLASAGLAKALEAVRAWLG